MKPGDRVRLSERGVRAIKKAQRRGLKYPLARCGTVQFCNDHNAMIIWDGRTSLDQIPIAAVELAEAA
jgi:hypothetical protein